MKKADKSKKRRISALKRGKKRGIRAKKSASLKVDRREKQDRVAKEAQHKLDVWTQKIMDSRVLNK